MIQPPCYIFQFHLGKFSRGEVRREEKEEKRRKGRKTQRRQYTPLIPGEGGEGELPEGEGPLNHLGYPVLN